VALQRRAEYEDIFKKALALFEDVPKSNPSPKVGALRLALAALDRLATWDQTIGFLPTPTSLVYLQLETRKVLDALYDGLQEPASRMTRSTRTCARSPARKKRCRGSKLSTPSSERISFVDRPVMAGLAAVLAPARQVLPRHVRQQHMPEVERRNRVGPDRPDEALEALGAAAAEVV